MAHGSVPEDFGVADGTPISNKNEVLRLIDEGLGLPSPDLEFIFVETSIRPTFISKITPFGHSAIRFKRQSGETVVMNIVGTKVTKKHQDVSMVNFLNPDDYFFGTNNFGKANEQAGIYNRTFFLLRIEKVDGKLLRALEAYYEALAARTEAGTAMFDLDKARVMNWLAQYR
jgi:hypothetical protein